MNKKRLVNVWVVPEFRTKLKVESSIKGLSIADYTKELSKNNENLNVNNALFEEKKKRGFKLEF